MGLSNTAKWHRAILAVGGAVAATFLVAANLDFSNQVILFTFVTCLLLPSVVGFLTRSRTVAVAGITMAIGLVLLIPERPAYVNFAGRADFWFIRCYFLWGSIRHVAAISLVGGVIGMAIGGVIELNQRRRVSPRDPSI